MFLIVLDSSNISQAMQAEKRVLIARYCYRKDSQPRMVALIPKKGQQHVLSWSTLHSELNCIVPS